MKGLRLHISPFTPDQSGAVSVFFGYGGMIIMLDAGGCIGNTCGFDEPRWFSQKSAIFSAGLRDMDAILGRDDLLIKKTGLALKDLDAKFIALVGTPVPSVIGTDYKALKRLMEKDYGLPVVYAETNGMDLYDKGIEAAYTAMFEEFAGDPYGGEEADPSSDFSDEKNTSCKGSRIGVLGALPLDMLSQDGAECIAEQIRLEELEENESADGADELEIICYGNGDSLDDVRLAGTAEKNIAVSPAGLAAARWLKSRFGTPFEIRYPMRDGFMNEITGRIASAVPFEDARILIVHQQVLAEEIRRAAADIFPESSIDCASWFETDEEIGEAYVLNEEDDLNRLIDERHYDVICGDPLLARVVDGGCVFVSLPHFAVSGKLHECRTEADYIGG